MERYIWQGRIPLRLVVWLCLFLAMYLVFFSFFSFKQTSLERTVAGLSPNTLYLIKAQKDVCPSDIVQFRSPKVKKSYIRRVAAIGASVISLTHSGYRVDQSDFEMSPGWMEAAIDIFPAWKERVLAPDELLVVNDDFGIPFGNEENKWPFEIISKKAITAKISRVALSRDLSQIGKPVGSSEPCQIIALAGPGTFESVSSKLTSFAPDPSDNSSKPKTDLDEKKGSLPLLRYSRY